MDKNQVYKFFKDKKKLEELCIKYISTFYNTGSYRVELKGYEYQDGGILHISATVYKNEEEPRQVLHVVSIDTLCGNN